MISKWSSSPQKSVKQYNYTIQSPHWSLDPASKDHGRSHTMPSKYIHQQNSFGKSTSVERTPKIIFKYWWLHYGFWATDTFTSDISTCFECSHIFAIRRRRYLDMYVNFWLYMFITPIQFSSRDYNETRCKLCTFCHYHLCNIPLSYISGCQTALN